MPSVQHLPKDFVKNPGAGRHDNGHGFVNHAMAGALVQANEQTGEPQYCSIYLTSLAYEEGAASLSVDGKLQTELYDPAAFHAPNEALGSRPS